MRTATWVVRYKSPTRAIQPIAVLRLIFSLGVKVIVKRMDLQIQVDVKTQRRKHKDNDSEI
jgi:hypothetical protein